MMGAHACIESVAQGKAAVKLVNIVSVQAETQENTHSSSAYSWSIMASPRFWKRISCSEQYSRRIP